MKTISLLLALLATSYTATWAQDTPLPPPPTAAADDPSAATPAPGDVPAETAPEEIIDATPYQMDRFSKLLSKSPFDFDVPPPPPEEKPIPMADWIIAGVSGTQDYTSVTIVNSKSNQRLTLNKYNNPELNSPSGKKDATGDNYKLIGIDFEPNKPRSRKNAKATIQRNNEPVGEVSWQEKADQMKPMAGAPNIQIPNNNINFSRAAAAAQNATNPNGLPQPGQVNAQGMPMNNNSIQAGLPGGTPQQGGVAPAQGSQGAVSGGQQQLLDLLNRSKTTNNTAQPAAQPAGTPGNAPLGRRRVVLPNPSATAPAPPLVNP